jgi:hypothetical protein
VLVQTRQDINGISGDGALATDRSSASPAGACVGVLVGEMEKVAMDAVASLIGYTILVYGCTTVVEPKGMVNALQ